MILCVYIVIIVFTATLIKRFSTFTKGHTGEQSMEFYSYLLSLQANEKQEKYNSLGLISQALVLFLHLYFLGCRANTFCTLGSNEKFFSDLKMQLKR